MKYPPFIKEYALSIQISDYSLETNGGFSKWKKEQEERLIGELSERISVKKTKPYNNRI